MNQMFKSILFKGINLRMFDEAGAGGGDGGAGAAGAGAAGAGAAGAGAGAGGDGGAAGGAGAGGEPAKPFASFPDEASFMARIKREGQKTLTDFLKGMGFEKAEDLQGVVTSHKENVEKSKTDLQKAQDNAANAEKTAADAITRANGILLNAEAKLQASALGVKSDRVGAALRLADLSGIEVKDGVVDQAALKTAIEAVVVSYPEFKGVAVPGAGGGDFGGGAGAGGGKQPLTWQLINNMSTTEAEARMPEIMEFMNKNKQ